MDAILAVATVDAIERTPPMTKEYIDLNRPRFTAAAVALVDLLLVRLMTLWLF